MKVFTYLTCLPTFKRSVLLLSAVCMLFASASQAQQSCAMKWMETQLACVRKDNARPTVQARNLAHASILMYDMWAVFDDDASTVFLGKTFNGFTCPFNGIALPQNRMAAQEKALSYAMYRFLTNRYQPFAPTPLNADVNNWVGFMRGYLDSRMMEFGYNPNITSTDYSDGDPAKLGNYIAAMMQQYALSDGANQASNYANTYYQTVNGPLVAAEPGNPNQVDPNRWQSLSLVIGLDQSGFPVSQNAPALSPEWGNVKPWALTQDQSTVYQRDGNNWRVYLDPGPLPFLDTETVQEYQWDEDPFRWNFVTCILWHALHDPNDGVSIDISPNSVGNIDHTILPSTFQEFKDFYEEFAGGPSGPGYDVNPATGLPYPEQIVPRADYTRVLSEYWADGPSSETPPGHWFKNINAIAQHPMFEKRWEGQGEILPDLEWDVRAYLSLGGAILDAAIACWSTKGYYDGTRPIMAIRYMCSKGQCSDMNLPSYHPAGIPLIPGYIELVEEGDPLAGTNNENVGKIKLYTWRGPVAATGQDNVGWILGENWWTFQKATFVTPPFPGYYSGHSTYSRTAAEVLTRITGSPYYPGGVGEFTANQNAYLAATNGPTVTTTLQWAKYYDAADQCSLSRIYGGLHPPADDIPGRRVGAVVGSQAVDKAETFMNAGIPHIEAIVASSQLINDASVGQNFSIEVTFTEDMNTAIDPVITFPQDDPIDAVLSFTNASWVSARAYELNYTVIDGNIEMNNVIVLVQSAQDPDGNVVVPMWNEPFSVDTDNPLITVLTASSTTINDDVAAGGILTVTFEFDQTMNTNVDPNIAVQPSGTGLAPNAMDSGWQNANTYTASFQLTDENTAASVALNVSNALDMSGNDVSNGQQNNAVTLDTENPTVVALNPSYNVIGQAAAATGFYIDVVYSETMDQGFEPVLNFTGADVSAVLSLVSESWINASTYRFTYNVIANSDAISGINVSIDSGYDSFTNLQVAYSTEDAFQINFIAPQVTAFSSSSAMLSDASVGNDAVEVVVSFDQNMDISVMPVLTLPVDVTSLTPGSAGFWSNPQTYHAFFNLSDDGVEQYNIDVQVSGAINADGNPLSAPFTQTALLNIDTRNPLISFVAPSVTDVNNAVSVLDLTFTFNEAMTTSNTPTIFSPEVNLADHFTLNAANSVWQNATTYLASYNVAVGEVSAFTGVDVLLANARDAHGNLIEQGLTADVFNYSFDVSVNELEEVTLNIWPNPIAYGQNLICQLKGVQGKVRYTIMDAQGRIVLSGSSNKDAAGNLLIDTAALSAGSYFVRVTAENQTLTQPFVVVK